MISAEAAGLGRRPTGHPAHMTVLPPESDPEKTPKMETAPESPRSRRRGLAALVVVTLVAVVVIGLLVAQLV